MHAAARHDIFIISDSDVRVARNYVREVVAPFADEKVGAVTCLYRGVADRGLWSKLEAAGMSVEMTSGVLTANLLEGMKFALGPTMAVRRSCGRRDGRLRRARPVLLRRFSARRKGCCAGQDGRAVPPRDRPHHPEPEFRRVAAAPDALDEVHALLAAAGATWEQR